MLILLIITHCSTHACNTGFVQKVITFVLRKIHKKLSPPVFKVGAIQEKKQKKKKLYLLLLVAGYQ